MKEGKGPRSLLTRFAVYEFEFKNADQVDLFKIGIFMYVPDICATKEKFSYAQAKIEVFKLFKTFSRQFQVNDHADLSEESFVKVMNH